MEIYEELGMIQVEPDDASAMENIDMNEILQDYMQQSAKLYNALIEKAVNGETLTDNEMMFIVKHEKQVFSLSKQSPIHKIINSLKELTNFFNDNEQEEND